MAQFFPFVCSKSEHALVIGCKRRRWNMWHQVAIRSIWWHRRRKAAAVGRRQRGALIPLREAVFVKYTPADMFRDEARAARKAAVRARLKRRGWR